MNILSAKEVKAIKEAQSSLASRGVLLSGSYSVVYCMFNKCISAGM